MRAPSPGAAREIPWAAAGLVWLVLAGLWFGAAAWLPAHWQIADPARLSVAATDLTVPAAPVTAPILPAGAVAPMHSPAFTYGAGWQVDARGADPPEPADPWQTPAGVVEFTYQGSVLALQLAQGDYWGYLYVTVDGAPANRLAHIPGNGDSRGRPAGYTTLYAPERAATSADDTRPVPAWHIVHIEDSTTPREARVEVWRSWGQLPLRGVAVDALPPPPWPMWPGVLLALAGLASLGVAAASPRAGARGGPRYAAELRRVYHRTRDALRYWMGYWVGRTLLRLFPAHTGARGLAAVGGVALLTLASALNIWWLSWLGLGILAAVALLRPAYWLAALAGALPFYYSVTLPLLPTRAFGLLDVGLGLGLVVVAFHRLCMPPPVEADAAAPTTATGRLTNPDRAHAILLWGVIGWALVATAAAVYAPQARYEWRTVFLAAGLFWWLLHSALPASRRIAATPQPLHKPDLNNLWLIMGGWLAGGIVMATLALIQYGGLLGDAMLITAEGVSRVRGLYGSPNNLALYLDRTLPATLGLALYLPPQTAARWRGALWIGAGLQLAALILTFSKGALLLALPAGFAALWLGGLLILPRQGGARRRLWWLLGLALVAALALTPFLGTERFRNLIDLSQGTGFLRLQLWRSALAMGWDHWGLGVGPDNFLYAFRSRYLLPAAWQEPNLNHPHNLLLDGWTRLGLPGLFALAAWLLTGLLGLWRALAAARRVVPTGDPGAAYRRAGTVALLAAAVAGIAHGLIDVSYALPDLMLVWVLIFGLGAAFHRRY